MEDRSKETLDVVRAAMALAERDVDLGLATVEQIQSIPRTRFAPAERKQLVALLKAEGKSNREIAEELGTSHQTVARDLDGPNGPKTGPNEPDEEPSELEQSRKREAALRDQLPQRDDDLEEPDEEGDLPTPKPDDEDEPVVNPLVVAWERASREERASFLHGLGRKVLSEAMATTKPSRFRRPPDSIDATVQEAADRAEVKRLYDRVLSAEAERAKAHSNGADRWSEK